MDGRSDVTSFVDKCTDSNVDNQYGDCKKKISLKIYNKTSNKTSGIFDVYKMLKEVEKEPSTDDLAMEIRTISPIRIDFASLKQQLSRDTTMFSDLYVDDEKVDVLHFIEELERIQMKTASPFEMGIVGLKMICAYTFKCLLNTFYGIKNFLFYYVF